MSVPGASAIMAKTPASTNETWLWSMSFATKLVWVTRSAPQLIRDRANFSIPTNSRVSLQVFVRFSYRCPDINDYVARSSFLWTLAVLGVTRWSKFLFCTDSKINVKLVNKTRITIIFFSRFDSEQASHFSKRYSSNFNSQLTLQFFFFKSSITLNWLLTTIEGISIVLR